MEEMKATPDYILVRSRWVNCNKGDAESPDIRARLVACEVNKGDKHDAFYASTPPLEAKKLLFARYAQERSRQGSRFNCHSSMYARRILMEFPSLQSS